MRWLFLIVLALNLVYVGWQITRPSDDLYENVPALKDVQTIVLLNETPEESPDSAPPEKEVANRPDDKDSAQVASKKLNQAGAESKESQEVAKQPEAEEKPVTEAIEADTADSLSLPVTQAESCFTLGPFRDLAKLRALTREIKSYVLEADFRGREEKQHSLYWVYIKPKKTQQEAVETGRRLKAMKIKDYYVIRDGEKKHGLSLGRFRNKKGAYGLAEKVKTLGFDVLVEPIFKTYTVYWLDYRLAGGVSIPESVFEKYTQSAKKDKITRLSRDCRG